jgi:hypothetical protein
MINPQCATARGAVAAMRFHVKKKSLLLTENLHCP